MLEHEALKQNSPEACNAGILRQGDQDPLDAHPVSAGLLLNELSKDSTGGSTCLEDMGKKVEVVSKITGHPNPGMSVISNQPHSLQWKPRVQKKEVVVINGKQTSKGICRVASTKEIGGSGSGSGTNRFLSQSNGLTARIHGRGGVLGGKENYDGKNSVVKDSTTSVIGPTNVLGQQSSKGRIGDGNLGKKGNSRLIHTNFRCHRLVRAPLSILERVASVIGDKPLNSSALISRKLMHNSKKSTKSYPSTPAQMPPGSTALNMECSAPPPVECTYHGSENKEDGTNASHLGVNGDTLSIKECKSPMAPILSGIHDKTMELMVKQQDLPHRKYIAGSPLRADHTEHETVKKTAIDLPNGMSAVNEVIDTTPQDEQPNYQKGKLRDTT